MKNIVVIGGGASGLLAAIFASKNGAEVTILEKNNICGKKILATGNGRCNYWNADQNIEHYKSQNINIVKNIVNMQNKNDIIEFFESIGIEPKIKNGYYYPFSNQAVSVQNALLLEIEKKCINIKNNIEVKKIEKNTNKFIIWTSEEKIYADRVILATGSKASLKMNSKANGYDICNELGIEILKPLPALVQLKGNKKFFKEWNGIRAEVSIELYENNKKTKTEYGEIQLTDYGISGICVFNLSSQAIRGLNEGKNEYVKINFLSGLNLNSIEDFMKWMDDRNNKVQNRTTEELLCGILNTKLIKILLKESNVDNKKYWKQLSQNEKEEIGKNIISLNIEITGNNSFDKAQVCSGGVKLTEINETTMESKKVKGLYITGEILDVDGDCGGYNLGWAWMTGMIAGKNAGKDFE